ncbi:hypothetical protein OG890_38800 [Streptomyces anulatus]|uniref:hypothetical protein n=1 Tax=Streptomyces anulatus TaxID=1892 RepID=UPI002251E563|nr:hypothetical protein [Streptomyces anulatus]MCX4489796.1 hypothetical protein [Streptomyces anulatus]MCX4489839.1 hypothetical protein [Streptomyces anulatus]MCX4523681.1 hypothetical protein [Streptomyces anulatus]MCX4523810.1 hypothetical protein [Streptomyces anulatus]MCX4606680.1 hypothetical protein [Streptomyces anulatus]
MATPTVEPKARKRRRKTRTKHISPLPPLVASEFKASQIDLTPGKESVRCPACTCWTPITGVLGKPMLVPHHTTPYHDPTPNPRRCSNTNRRIVLNTATDAWREQLAERTEVSASVASRRATKVLPKPRKGPAPTPVHRLATQEPQSAPALPRLVSMLERARRDIDRHHIACFLCRAGGRCETGRALEIRAAETQASCTIAREQLHRQERQERQQGGRSAAPTRRSQWAAVLPAVRDADTRRTSVPVSPGRVEAPAKVGTASVPTEPEHLEAHDRRQAELGKQYARLADQPA